MSSLSPLEKARFNMIEQQIRPWEVLDQTVLDTMKHIPRENFVPEIYRTLAFSDTEIPLGHGESMMSPKIEGRMLQELTISPSDICLEIGTGSGYVTACMAHLAKHVYSVEYYQDISIRAQDQLDYHKIFNVELSIGDASYQWQNPMEERYDVIAMTASMPRYNPVYEQKLNVDGRLFVIVGQAPVMQAMLVTRLSETEFNRMSLFETCIKPLIGTEDAAFVF